MTVINATWLETHRRANASIWGASLQYLDSAGGVRSIIDLVQKSAQGLMSVDRFRFLNGLDSQLGAATGVIGFTFIPTATTQAIQSMRALAQGGVSFSFRSVEKAAKNTFDALATYGYCLEMIKTTLLGRVAQVAELSSDLIDLHISYSDYIQASHLEMQATKEDDKEVFCGSKRAHFLRGMRAAISISLLIFSLAMWITGASILSQMTLTGLTLSLSASAVIRDIYKDSRRYPVIEFDQEVKLQEVKLKGV